MVLLFTLPGDAVRSAALDALAVLMPVVCAGCGAPDRAVCADCMAQLRVPVIRRQLGAPLSPSLTTFAALRYEGAVRRCILALKEQGRTDVARALAPALARAVTAALEQPALAHHSPGGIRVCPIPQGVTSERSRGYDPVRMLARRALGGRVERMLRPTRHRGAQKLLGVQQRLSNTAGAFEARGPLAGVSVLLVDDVVTTGATLLEAARAVRAAGGVVVGAAALASTPLHSRGL